MILITIINEHLYRFIAGVPDAAQLLRLQLIWSSHREFGDVEEKGEAKGSKEEGRNSTCVRRVFKQSVTHSLTKIFIRKS
jgi:hypothetical protein